MCKLADMATYCYITKIMYVHFKQSGELMSSTEFGLWTPDAVRATVEKLNLAHLRRDELDMEGLMVVSGAGNVIRGESLKTQKIAPGYEDSIGRLATVQNSLVLKAALSQVGVPVALFTADSMTIGDKTIGKVEPYDVEAVHEAYNKERVVIVAGGTGEDNSTTDNAVLEYASRHKNTYPEEDVLILKGTKVDGVFTSDPTKDGEARRYISIPAKMMLDDYDRFRVVDQKSLWNIITSGLCMRVYKDESHDLTTVIAAGLSHDYNIGTLIVPDSSSEALLAQ